MRDSKGVLILTDLEGISDVSVIDAIPTGTPLYRDACEKLMGDTAYAGSPSFDGRGGV